MERGVRSILLHSPGGSSPPPPPLLPPRPALAALPLELSYAGLNERTGSTTADRQEEKVQGIGPAKQRGQRQGTAAFGQTRQTKGHIQRTRKKNTHEERKSKKTRPEGEKEGGTASTTPSYNTARTQLPTQEAGPPMPTSTKHTHTPKARAPATPQHASAHPRQPATPEAAARRPGRRRRPRVCPSSLSCPCDSRSTPPPSWS